MRHFLRTMDQQSAGIALRQAEHAFGKPGGQAADEVASPHMLAAHPKAGSHLAAAGNRADMMGQIANVNRRITKAYARADNGRLAVIVQAGIGKAKAGGRDKANRAPGRWRRWGADRATRHGHAPADAKVYI